MIERIESTLCSVGCGTYVHYIYGVDLGGVSRPNRVGVSLGEGEIRSTPSPVDALIVGSSNPGSIRDPNGPFKRSLSIWSSGVTFWTVTKKFQITSHRYWCIERKMSVESHCFGRSHFVRIRHRQNPQQSTKTAISNQQGQQKCSI